MLTIGSGREHPKHGSGLGMAVSAFGLARPGASPDLAAVNPKLKRRLVGLTFTRWPLVEYQRTTLEKCLGRKKRKRKRLGT